MLDELLHPSMVDRVEERPDVRIEHPVHLLLADGYRERIQGIVRRPAGPEAVRKSEEHALIDGLRYPPHRVLDDLVFQGGDAERPRAIALRDVHSADRQRMVAPAMNAVLEVEQIGVQLLALLFPRHPIHAWRRLLPEAQIGLLQKRNLHVAQPVGEPFLPVIQGSLSDSFQGRGRADPVLSPGRVSWNEFPVGRTPFLHRLLGRYPRVRRLLRYYACVRPRRRLRPRLAPSRGCLPVDSGEAPPRSPGSRAKGLCELAEVSDPGGTAATRSTLSVVAAWPSA